MQDDLFAPPALPERAEWSGDLKRAAEIAERWSQDFGGDANAGGRTVDVPLGDLVVVAAAILRLASATPDGKDPASPVAFLETWLAKDSVSPLTLTPGQGRKLLDGIRAMIASGTP